MKFPTILSNFLLFSFSIYIPLLLYSSISTYRNQPTNHEKSVEKSLESRLTIQKVEAIKSGYTPAWLPQNVVKYVKSFDFYPIGSLPFQNSYYCDEGYGLIKYKTDRFGLRNPDVNWDKTILIKVYF
mgnify:CR=1 FL=1